MSKKPASNVRTLQLAVNTTAEQSEEYGKVLCQLRGVPAEVAANMKTFSLDLAAFGGEVPEQYDGLAVEVTVDPENDTMTDHYLVPANFKVIEIVPEAYRPKRVAVDLDAYLASLGIK